MFYKRVKKAARASTKHKKREDYKRDKYDGIRPFLKVIIQR